jgi:hypothetical protein
MWCAGSGSRFVMWIGVTIMVAASIHDAARPRCLEFQPGTGPGVRVADHRRRHRNPPSAGRAGQRADQQLTADRRRARPGRRRGPIPPASRQHTSTRSGQDLPNPYQAQGVLPGTLPSVPSHPGVVVSQLCGPRRWDLPYHSRSVRGRGRDAAGVRRGFEQPVTARRRIPARCRARQLGRADPRTSA